MGAASFLATPSVSPRALNAVSAFTQMRWQNFQLPIETQKRRLYPLLWDRHARGATTGSRKCWQVVGKGLFLQVFALGVQLMLVVRSKRSHRALTTNPCEQTILSVKPHVSIQCCCVMCCAVNNKHVCTQTKMCILTGVGDGQKIQPSLLLKKKQRDIRGLLSEGWNRSSLRHFFFFYPEIKVCAVCLLSTFCSLSLSGEIKMCCAFYINFM